MGSFLAAIEAFWVDLEALLNPKALVGFKGHLPS